jgi:tRNA threonylcarbamoyladenosine biosynthesis protein TsaE
MQLEIRSITNIKEMARLFLEATSDKRVFAFYGQMGAGKTTFIKALCEELGVRETINSPTFSIVNEYGGKNNVSIYHFDFYRINSIEEAFDFGYEDYFYSGNYCFIEWPELVENLLPANCVKVYIEEKESGTRTIHF